MADLCEVITLIIGLLVAFFGNSFIFELHNSKTELVFFSGKQLDTNVLQLKNWLFGIIGATIAGFHLLVIMISENAFKLKQKWAYDAVLYSMVLWFTIDSSISIYYGALYNVLLINLPALFMICLPLVMTKRDFENNDNI